ncbi:hypothetical protein FGO68_gene7865 [Halteria grandinella]|uniref:Uncharacterized protein n=1 Tax=Halteria grandinella TaxID=5974 RepID=A0A8J8NZD5_HALGN|nr:hypothetical protein FGO68_gene7865 [Halteria grandinella]
MTKSNFAQPLLRPIAFRFDPDLPNPESIPLIDDPYLVEEYSLEEVQWLQRWYPRRLNSQRVYHFLQLAAHRTLRP